MKKKSGKTGAMEGGQQRDDHEQSQRFIETAVELNTDTTGRKFRKALKKIGGESATKNKK